MSIIKMLFPFRTRYLAGAVAALTLMATAVIVTHAGAAGVTAAKDNFELRETIAFASLRDGNFEVYLMNPDGTNQRRLTANSDGDAFANLSPDGKKIVFDSNRNRVAPGTLVDQDGNLCPIAPGGTQDPSVFVSDLFLMNTDGGEQRLLRSRGSSADWSPDGKHIVFHMSASGKGCPSRSDPGAAATDSDIFVADVDDLLAGAEPVNITKSPLEVDDDADWSSTDRIVYTAHDVGDDVTNPNPGAAAGASSQSARMYVINPDGTGRARVTDSNVEERAPAWSPDGNTIAYLCRIRDGRFQFPDFADFEICVVSAHPNPDGTLPTPTILTDNTVADLGASWSPDGQQLFIQRVVPGQGNQLFTMAPRLNPDGTLPKATQRTFPPGGNFFPQWGVQRVKTKSP